MRVFCSTSSIHEMYKRRGGPAWWPDRVVRSRPSGRRHHPHLRSAGGRQSAKELDEVLEVEVRGDAVPIHCPLAGHRPHECEACVAPTSDDRVEAVPVELDRFFHGDSHPLQGIRDPGLGVPLDAPLASRGYHMADDGVRNSRAFVGNDPLDRRNISLGELAANDLVALIIILQIDHRTLYMKWCLRTLLRSHERETSASSQKAACDHTMN